MDHAQVKNFLAGLIIDGVDRAGSGHPGGALSSLDFAYALFTGPLRYDPDDPEWVGRDRFILSAGHESMLLYSLLYATGWLERSDLEAFRTLGSRTPGHPEVHQTPGVECTTGPLGQGAAMAVGFAIAAAHRDAVSEGVLPHPRTWVLLGDGCMQEGITYGAASLAGHLQLDHLIWYYDRNGQQISGSIDRAYSDNIAAVYRGLGWRVLEVDGHEEVALAAALATASQPAGQPTLIVGTTIMAKGCATLEGSHKTHGAPLPATERDASKHKWGIPAGACFYFPDEARARFQSDFSQRRAAVRRWHQSLAQARDRMPAASQVWDALAGPQTLTPPEPMAWEFAAQHATRNAFGKVLAHYGAHLPQLIGGSADLEPSNMTEWFAAKVGEFTAGQRRGRNIQFGVREFPMAAIANGIALAGGYVPFTATFLSFADYARPAIRLGALQKARVLHELTHDSFYLGEDGPTHQPVEHLMSLRAMPGIDVMRPGDANETEAMMALALRRPGPSAHCLTRQKVPVYSGRDQWPEIQRGAWCVRDGGMTPKIVIFASGSEVSLALAVAETWPGMAVVSVPCWEVFFEQDQAFQKHVLMPQLTRRVSLEAGSRFGWERFVGRNGLRIGIDHFGDSAPAEALAEAYGFTPVAVRRRIAEHFSIEPAQI